MSALVSMSRCPNCGAPLSVDGAGPSVICIFCNTSLRVARPSAGEAVAELAAIEVSGEDVERVKQLLLDGKRDEAIAHYARVAAVSAADAERAVENVYLSAYWILTRHLPINLFGVALYGGLVSLGGGLAAWAASAAGDTPALWALVALGGGFAFHQCWRFLQHLRATWVCSFGALGRGRVLRRAVVREIKERDGFFVVVLFEVTPEDGSAPFVDRETLFVGPQTLEKLAPDNVVRVRFDRGRRHVYPATPIAVLAGR